jgi:hypothetical protein
LPEHANLAQDMVPISGSVELVSQDVMQLLTHFNNTVCHCFDILIPLLEESSVVHYKGHLTNPLVSLIAKIEGCLLCEHRVKGGY